MKNLSLLLCFCLAFFMLQAQQQTFIYSQKGEKIYFERNENIQYIHFASNADTKNKATFLDEVTAFATSVDEITPEIYRFDFSGKQILSFLSKIKDGGIIKSYSSEYRLPNSNTIRWITNKIYVKIKEGYTIEKVMQLANLSYQFAEPVGSIPKTFLLQIEGEDIFLASQRLYETGSVEYSLPSFFYLFAAENKTSAIEETVPNRSSNDWNLKDCNFYGMNAINAWNITIGNPNVKVAIVDDGIRLDHPALISSLVHGYTSFYHSAESINGEAGSFDVNGTQAAGIIASSNNVQGNYGIARNAKIIPVKVRENVHLVGNEKSGETYFSSMQSIIDGLNWLNDSTTVDIINFSWTLDEIERWREISNIESVLNYMTTHGRNEKGIVCIVASGNHGDNTVGDPATLTNVITVGATGSNGMKLSSSNYGIDLDVVAPGDNITTTTINPLYPFTNTYSNTNAAAAHVSGVAALMLSVNPDLTANEVKNIIEQTACKAHPSTYVYYYNPVVRPNGLWNQYMGYGIVNAYAAVQTLLVNKCNNNLPAVSGTITQNTTWSTPVNICAPVTIPAGVTLTVTSTVECSPGVSISIKAGGKLIVNGGTLTSACPDKMWQGIYVGGNVNLPQFPTSNQGVLELKNNAVISNAKNAIATHTLTPGGNTDWNTTGGIIKAENTTFINNKRSVEFLSYSAEYYGHLLQNVSYFKKCKFIVDNNNIFASNNYDFYAHITMWKVTGVTITGCEFKNETTGGADRGYAIDAIDAGYIVDQHCSGLPTGICSSCNVPPTLTSFSGFKTAIATSYTGAQYTPQIDFSSFENNITGISLQGNTAARISRSNMLLNTSYSNYPIGISLNSCTDYQVEGNDISSNGNDKSIGVLVLYPGTNENKIYRNKIYNTWYGIQVDAPPLLNQARVKLPATGLQFVCNDLNNNHYDIYVVSPGRIREVQGAAGAGADNMFSASAIWNFAVETQQQISYYYNPSNPRKIPANITNNITINTTTANPCPNTFCEVFVGKSNSSELISYRELNNKYTEMLRHFYAKGFDKILIDYDDEIIKDEELLKEAMAYHEALLILTEEMATLSNETLLKLKTDEEGIDLYQIRDWYEEINTLSAKYSLAETYYQLGKFEEGLKTLNLIPKMFNLNEYEMIEHNNYVSLFRFKNKIRESGRTIAELKEDEIKQMSSFATVSTGLSSVMAQNILCFFYDICIEAEGGKQKAESEEDRIDLRKSITSASSTCKIKLYPNPGKDYFTVVSDVSDCRFDLIDARGGVQQTVILQKGSNFIDTSSLPEGFYIYRAITNDKVMSGKWLKINRQ